MAAHVHGRVQKTRQHAKQSSTRARDRRGKRGRRIAAKTNTLPRTNQQ
jgi:hypothetical protein